MSGLICTHVRIYENEIVYLPSTLDEFSYCIYCYSNKKKKQMITLIANIRDYNDEENNDIFNFIEANNVTVKLVDYENYLKQEEELDKNLDIFLLVDKKEKVFLINHEVFPISVFFEVIEKRILSSMGNSTCCLCGKKLNLYIDNYKCISCLCSDDTLGNPNAKCNQQIQHGNQIKNKRINNPYHFVQKLKLNLKQFYYPIFSQEYRKHIPAIFN